jgi:hypothetical protein
MKKIILSIVSVFCLLNVIAQNDSVAAKKNSLSINVNGLLAQMFTGNNSSQSLLTYRRHFSKCNLRVGMNGYTHISDDYSVDNPVYNFSYTRFGLRSGVEFPILQFRKWHAYLGVEAVGGVYEHRRNQHYDTGVVENERTTLYSMGISAPCGINYQLNQLISFGAEAAYDVIYEGGTTITKTSFANSVYNETTEYHDNLIASYSSPIRLQVRVHF